MTLLADLRARRLAPELSARRGEYAPIAPAERRRIQLELLNTEWQRATVDVPYLRRMRSERSLPTSFRSLEEFADRVPPLSRSDVQMLGAELRSVSRAPEIVRMTGGSTASPVQIPSWHSELAEAARDMWLARSWYGIRPASRLFLLWGHSHLLGTGLRGWLRGRQREISDLLLGYHRFSAYDLRPEKLRRAAEEMKRFRPEYVVGYSVALDLFARANETAGDALRALGLRAVIGTAESFPYPDSASRLEALFGCPVAMEYGAVECGLVAHTHPDGGYRVFWRNLMVEAVASEGRHRVLLTSLYPRSMPLVRYEIGDEVELSEPGVGATVGLEGFARVIGRCNQYVALDDGATIHSEVFSHALRPCAEVRGFQVASRRDGLAIRYVSDAPLSEQRENEIRERLGRVHPTLVRVRLEQVEALPQTVAGKTRMVVVE